MEVGMEVGVELAWEAAAREGVEEMGMPAALKRPGKVALGAVGWELASCTG